MVTVQADFIFKLKENICGSKKKGQHLCKIFSFDDIGDLTIIATIITCLLLCEEYCNSPNLAYYYKYFLNELFSALWNIRPITFCVLGQCVIIELLL